MERNNIAEVHWNISIISRLNITQEKKLKWICLLTILKREETIADTNWELMNIKYNKEISNLQKNTSSKLISHNDEKRDILI